MNIYYSISTGIRIFVQLGNYSFRFCGEISEATKGLFAQSQHDPDAVIPRLQPWKWKITALKPNCS
ncbi:MAG: hypothetical protein JWP44_4133 [Mucilaginibacter sp.]|nr:hypothetical protein [Mucilaginibacter sp.]